MNNYCCYAKLHAISFGLALGIIWAIVVFLTGIVAWGTGWGESFVEVMGSGYLGFVATPLGSFVGAIWGFVDMFIMGVVIAALYNLFMRLCGKNAGSCCGPDQSSKKSDKRTK